MIDNDKDDEFITVEAMWGKDFVEIQNPDCIGEIVRIYHKQWRGEAQPEPKPVAWMEIESYLDADGLWESRKVLRDYDNGIGVPLYTAPPQQHSEQWWKHEVSNAFANGYEKGRAKREWRGLTDEERRHIDEMTLDKEDAIRLTAVALEEKNNG